MKLWIDCEWNDFRGDLISVALVQEKGPAFYEVLPCGSPSPWVRENVMPVLGRPAIDLITLREKLRLYLRQFDTLHIIADWPEDIERFCWLLIVGPGMRIDTPPLTFEIVRLEGTSDMPHNALADAVGLRAAYLAAQS